MKMTIILATYNGAEYLQEQLQSILRQTRLPDELLIGDDASEDRTTEIAEEFARTAPFVTKVIKNAGRIGYKQNFSRLVAQASGDIFIFCDQDDVWSAKKLEVLESYFVSNPNVMCAIHDIAIVDAQHQTLNPSYLSLLDKLHIAPETFVKGCATAVRKELTNVSFPLAPESNWSHDSIVHAIAMATRTRGLIPSKLIDHRIHSSNTSGFIPSTPTLLHRICALIEKFETSGLSPRIFLLPTPRDCSKEDLEFLLGAISRLQGRLNFNASDTSLQIRALSNLLRVRKKARIQPLPEALRFVFEQYKIGAFREIGSFKVLAIECLLIVSRSMSGFLRKPVTGI